MCLYVNFPERASDSPPRGNAAALLEEPYTVAITASPAVNAAKLDAARHSEIALAVAVDPQSARHWNIARPRQHLGNGKLKDD
jgi:hypothetical protein